MICDLCKKNESVIFLEASGPAGRRKINLCQQCAAARGIVTPVVAPDAKNLSAIFKEIEEKEMLIDEKSKRLCPVCGKNLYMLLKTGIAGCPECYQIFKSEIQENLKDHGIVGSYTGSMPKRLNSFRSALTDRADLQAKLDEAVRTENYEKAAVYRDFLKALEKNAVSDGSSHGEGNEDE